MTPTPRPERVFNLSNDTSGPRPVSAINLIVLHTTEGHDVQGLGDLDGLYQYANGPVQASWTIANDREGNDARYLGDGQVPWTQGRRGHSRNFNREALSVEQIAFARYPRSVWLRERMPQLDNTALWVAYWSEKYDIPLVHSTTRGVCQHRDISGPGGHSDCGEGYPFDVVLEKAIDLRHGKAEPPSREQLWTHSLSLVKGWEANGYRTLKDAGEALKALLAARGGTPRQLAIWQDRLTRARRLASIHGWGAELDDLGTLLERLLQR